ncbi:hypothetical protein GQ457_06G013580 [Hibiscus cannabinus]
MDDVASKAIELIIQSMEKAKADDSSPDETHAVESSPAALDAHARDDIFYSYTRHINGFAANLDDEVAVKIASKASFSIYASGFSVLELWKKTACNLIMGILWLGIERFPLPTKDTESIVLATDTGKLG